MNHLILFADYGLDDAAATVSILERAHRFSAIDLVPIGGNVPVEVAFRNCFTLLSFYPSVWEKVRVIDTTHIPQPSEYLKDIHGQDGMGDVFTPAKAEVDTILFEDWQITLNGTETVLSLGPATLVKPLMERADHPLVMMAGCINTPPNFQGFEFNHCLDKSAFSYCAPKAEAVITLDTCRVPALDVSHITPDKNTVHGTIIDAAQRMTTAWDSFGCHMWDDVAACYVLFPERFTTHPETDPHGNTYCHGAYSSDKVYYKD